MLQYRLDIITNQALTKNINLVFSKLSKYSLKIIIVKQHIPMIISITR